MAKKLISLEKKARGRPKGSGNSGGRAPNFTHTAHSVTLPEEYDLYFDSRTPEELKHLTEEEKANPDRGRLTKHFQEIADKSYKNSKGKVAIFRYALDQLWERRNHPSISNMEAGAAMGITHMVPDFHDYQFAQLIASAGETLFIVTPDLASILRTDGIRIVLAQRIIEKRFTRISTRLFTNPNDGAVGFDKSTAEALSALFEVIPKRVRSEIVNGLEGATDDDDNPSPFKLYAVSTKHAQASMRIVLTDKLAVAALHSVDSMRVPIYPAVVCRPSLTPTAAIYTRKFLINAESAVVTGSIPSTDMWTTYLGICHTLKDISNAKVDYTKWLWTAIPVQQVGYRPQRAQITKVTGSVDLSGMTALPKLPDPKMN